MPEFASYYLQRLKIFLLIFLAIESLTRGVFLWVEHANLPLHPGMLLAVFSLGLGYDLCVFAYLAAVFCLYLWALPRYAHGSRLDRNMTTGWLFVFTFGLLFTSVSEWFFWEEFHTRFNFIAVDYLVYRREVTGNIWESYPVVPLVSIMALLAVIVAYTLRRRALPRAWKTPRQSVRALALAICIGVAVLGYVIFSDAFAEKVGNRYAQEASKNGIYELLSAFQHNELDYDRFYATAPANEMKAELAQLLGGDPSRARSIRGAGPEQHYNVVLITIESMSASFMQSFGNKRNLTPVLDALSKESLFFTNLYATGTRTVYGLSATSLSVPPLPGNSIVRRPENEGLFTLGSVLGQHGYDSRFLYGGYGYFDNMNHFFGSNGYRVVDRSELAPDESTFTNVWGVSDEDLYRRVIRENDAAFATGKPFFDHVMTTSNHRPFTYPDGRIDMPSHSGRFGAVKYTDYAIGKFLAEARTKPWFKNTLFVITADHTANSAGKQDLDPAGYHIPLLIYAPGIVQPRRVDTLTSQIDIPPTILGLMNLNYESRFWGQDAIKTPPHRAFVSNYQQLGYLTDDALVVLKPVKRVDIYRRAGEDFLPDAHPREGLLPEALSYYQNATHWRTWNHSDAPRLASSDGSPHAPAAH